MTAIRVSSAYQGIPGIAHGGYVAGLLAEQAGEPLRVTLRRPPPLDTPLSIDDSGEGLALRDPQGRLVMEAGPAVAAERRLPTVTLDEARARAPHPRFAERPYPVCFVCGTQHGSRWVSAAYAHGVATGVWAPSGPLLPDGDAVPPTAGCAPAPRPSGSSSGRRLRHHRPGTAGARRRRSRLSTGSRD